MDEVNQLGDGSAALVTCELCGATPRADEAKLANGHRVCPACAAQLQAELAQASVPQAILPRAIAAGVVGALLGAAVWAAVVIVTDFEIGYLAVLVGFLAGFGVKYGARGATGKVLQQAAVGCTLLGLLATKYIVFAHYLSGAAAKEGVQLGYLSPGMLMTFPRALVGMLSPFDLLWLFLALTSAWRVPAPPRVMVTR